MHAKALLALMAFAGCGHSDRDTCQAVVDRLAKVTTEELATRPD
jgi:hypothetical protein